jgi:hypothetical protein
MKYYQWEGINLICSLLPVIACGIRFKLLDAASRVFFVLLSFAFLTECVACYAAVKYHDNTAVYNISDLAQIFLIMLYFNYCIPFFRKRNIGLFFGILSSLLGILNFVYFQSINTYDNIFFLYQGSLVLTMGIILYRQLLLSPHIEVRLNPHFWLAVALASFYVLNSFAMSLYDYYTKQSPDHKYLIDNAILYLNALVNIEFTLIFFFYPKMKLRDAL